MLSKVATGAALAAASVAQGASAKAGQFGKVEIFGFGTSSPFVGEKVVGESKDSFLNGYTSTYGFAPTGDILAKDFAADVSREKKVFEKSAKLMGSLQPDIDSKTWWKVRDQLRGTDVYSMRGAMLSINNVLPADKKDGATKAYKKYWQEVEAFDLACTKKEQALATKKNGDMLAALKAYSASI